MRILTKMSCSHSDNQLIFPDNASPHAMKDVTGVPPDRLCISLLSRLEIIGAEKARI